MTHRVVLVDDHELFRDGLRFIFESQTDLEVVGEAGEAREAYRVIEATHPDVVLLDVALPGINGIAAARELTRRERSRKILFLTMHCDEEFVAQALSAGAIGYALKHQPRTEILDAVRSVANGHSYLCPRISRVVVDNYLRERQGNNGAARPLEVLSPREREVFDLLVRGYSNEGVSGQLCISVKTVETHRSHILKKLHVHSLVDLVRFAAKHNLIADADRGVA